MASSRFEGKKVWHVRDGKPTILGDRQQTGRNARVPWKAIAKLETYEKENQTYKPGFDDDIPSSSWRSSLAVYP